MWRGMRHLKKHQNRLLAAKTGFKALNEVLLNGSQTINASCLEFLQKGGLSALGPSGLRSLKKVNHS